MASDTILVTGATGLLGPYVTAAASRLGRVVTLSRHQGDIRVDLTSKDDVARAVTEVRPTAVIHAAAMTDVDACERDEQAAAALNDFAVRHLAEVLPSHTRLLLVSTDQVYPDVPGPHRESDVGPVNAYGRTKLGGEMHVRCRPRSSIVRVNFFGPSKTRGRKSFSDFVISALRKGDATTLFDDVRFNPLHLETTANVLVEATKQGIEGVYNAGARTSCTKAELGLLIATHLGLATTSVTIGNSGDAPGRAPRPHDLTTDITRFTAALGISFPTVEEEVCRL